MNTQLFAEAKVRAERLHVRSVLVATNSGASVCAAQDTMGPEFRYFAVGNPSTSHDKGLVLHSGIAPETRAYLEARGITVVTQEVSIFQASPTKDCDQSAYRTANEAYRARFGHLFPSGGSPGDICMVMSHILGEFFGDGPRVCLEITLMAADSGLLPLAKDCLALATPCGYAHAGVIVHPVTTRELFSTHFRVKDLFLYPAADDIWFNDGMIP